MSMFNPFYDQFNHGHVNHGYLDNLLVPHQHSSINQNIFHYLETQSILARKQEPQKDEKIKTKQQLLLLTTGEQA